MSQFTFKILIAVWVCLSLAKNTCIAQDDDFFAPQADSIQPELKLMVYDFTVEKVGDKMIYTESVMNNSLVPILVYNLSVDTMAMFKNLPNARKHKTEIKLLSETPVKVNPGIKQALFSVTADSFALEPGVNYNYKSFSAHNTKSAKPLQYKDYIIYPETDTVTSIINYYLQNFSARPVKINSVGLTADDFFDFGKIYRGTNGSFNEYETKFELPEKAVIVNPGKRILIRTVDFLREDDVRYWTFEAEAVFVK